MRGIEWNESGKEGRQKYPGQINLSTETSRDLLDACEGRHKQHAIANQPDGPWGIGNKTNGA